MYILTILVTLVTAVPLCTFLTVKYIAKVYIKEIRNLERENEMLAAFLAELQRRSAENYNKLKQIDRRGSFESDDEVGYIFKYIKDIVMDTHTVLTSYMKKE